MVDAIVNNGVAKIEAETANKRIKEKAHKNDDIDFGFKSIVEAEKANELSPQNGDDISESSSTSDGSSSSSSSVTSDDEVPPPPPPEVVNDVYHSMIESMPRTKEDIMGWCSNDDDEDPRIEDMGYLAKELYNRFKTLHCEFLKKGRYEHRNDLMFLLNEMVRRGFIDQKGYEKALATLDVVFNEEENADGFKKLLHSTVSYMLAYDKKELRELLDEFEDVVEEEEGYAEDISKLEKLVHTYFRKDFLDGEPILPMIEEILRRLEDSNIAKSSQQRFKTLLKDVENNRYRVHSVLTRLKEVEEDRDIKHVLQQLAKEELLSEEEFQKIVELEEVALPIVADIIKESKTGQGIKFLPRTVVGLTAKLPLLEKELKETGLTSVRDELSAVLEELYRQEGIPYQHYFTLKKDNNIL